MAKKTGLHASRNIVTYEERGHAVCSNVDEPRDRDAHSEVGQTEKERNLM